MKIDTTQLKADLENPEKREAALAEFIDNLEIIILNFNAMKLEVEKLSNTSKEAIEAANTNLKVADDLCSTIKNVHIILNADNKEAIDEIKIEIARFVLTPFAIQSGVRQKARLENEKY